jgi:hypothetical protein
MDDNWGYSHRKSPYVSPGAINHNPGRRMSLWNLGCRTWEPCEMAIEK